MGTPGTFFDNSSELAEWLPLLGSIVHALRGADGLAPNVRPHPQAEQRETAAPPDGRDG